jgi:hypothetical protein
VWTEDTDFFGIGVAVWTTNRIEIFLKGQAQSLESQDESRLLRGALTQGFNVRLLQG